MTLTVPLGVRLRNATGTRCITPDLQDLSFSSTVPGGMEAAEAVLAQPLNRSASELAPFSEFTVFDTRHGEIVWQGELEDPGRSATAAGQVWALRARGGAQIATDETRALIYVDTRLDAFARADNVTTGGEDSITEDPGGSGASAIVLKFPQGLALVTNSRVVVRYRAISEVGMRLARFDYAWDAGQVGGLDVQAVTRGPGGGEVARAETFTTAGGGLSGRVVVTNFPAGRDLLDLRNIRTGAAVTVGDDNGWAAIRSVSLRTVLRDVNGSDILTGYTANTVRADEVVRDLLGRVLIGAYDGATASIVTGTTAIGQLAYPDGATPAKVFEDLMTFEPDTFWAAWERTASGKYRFEWSRWPTTVRYYVSDYESFEAPASTAELYDSVLVRWRDDAGRLRSTVVTQTVAALSGASRPRRGFVDLGDEAGTAALATAAGSAFLAQHRDSPNSGSLVVSSRVFDTLRGRWVQPYEMRPGSLVGVRRVNPRPDALNAPGRDGLTIFRLPGVAYSAGEGAATLTLDNAPLAGSEQIARLNRLFEERRRR